ncbi:MAG: FecR family protein [Treponema sp.]|jgi:hypothetical protein|nr:FecR family protein [Treponema sp.]
MKRLFFLPVCMTALCLMLPILGAEELLTQIEEVSGKVEVKTPGSAVWVAAQKGMTLKKDAQISTSFKSSAVLIIGGSKVTVRALTRLSVEEIGRANGQDQVKLAMSAGNIRADVKAPEGGKIDFSVRGPSATASVRGTEFNLSTKKLSVISGSVALAGGGGKIIRVNAGRSSTVSDNGKLSSPVNEGGLYPSLPAGLGGISRPAAPIDDRAANGGINVELGF